MQKSCKRAITLIEVVVALSLFAVSILLLSQGFINGLMCKRTLFSNSPRALYFDVVRCSLGKLKRDQVASSHSFYLPDRSEESVQWSGAVETTPFLGLYRIAVKFKGDEESYDFYMRRKDWITQSEQLQLRKSFENDVDTHDEAS